MIHFKERSSFNRGHIPVFGKKKSTCSRSVSCVIMQPLQPAQGHLSNAPPPLTDQIQSILHSTNHRKRALVFTPHSAHANIVARPGSILSTHQNLAFPSIIHHPAEPKITAQVTHPKNQAKKAHLPRFRWQHFLSGSKITALFASTHRRRASVCPSCPAATPCCVVCFIVDFVHLRAAVAAAANHGLYGLTGKSDLVAARPHRHLREMLLR